MMPRMENVTDRAMIRVFLSLDDECDIVEGVEIVSAVVASDLINELVVLVVEVDVSVPGAELVDLMLTDLKLVDLILFKLMLFDVTDEELKVCVENPVEDLEEVRDVDVESCDEVDMIDVWSVEIGVSIDVGRSIVGGGKSEATNIDGSC